MTTRKGLGKGLAALISEADVPAETGMSVSQVSLDQIDPNPFQPRQVFDEESIEELKQSIQVQGLLQPVLLRQAGERYQLIVGERRWRAAKAAGLSEIPALVRESATDEEMLELALLENVQRKDLNPIELAQAIQSLQTTCSLTQDQIAQKLGVSRTQVANILRLLRLPREIQDALAGSKLTIGHARTLLSVEDPRRRYKLFQSFLADARPTVREAEALTRRPGSKGSDQSPRERQMQAELRRIEDRLRRHLATRVRIRPRGHGGVLEIQFFTSEDLERILEIIEP